MSSILEIIVGAAVEASHDLGDAGFPLEDVEDRNEARTASYVAVRLNDHLRKTLNDGNGVFVTHEARVSWMDDLTRTARPSAGDLRSGQRFDLAAWDHEHITGLIEIKNAPGMDRHRATIDAVRLREALARWGQAAGGSLRWGVYLFSLRLRRAALSGGHLELKRQFDKRIESFAAASDHLSSVPAFRVVDENRRSCLAWGAISYLS